MNHWGTDFSFVQELGTNALGGQVIQGSFTGTIGVACEGIFTTTICDVGSSYVSEDITNIYSNQIDIMSQKNSDSILGQERIYDTETDEVYLADLGWSDSNSDPRYELVTEDSYYLIPTSGWID